MLKVKKDMEIVAEHFLPFIHVQAINSFEEFSTTIGSKCEEIVSSKGMDIDILLRYATECLYQFVELNWSSPVQPGADEISQSFGVDGCNLPPFSKSPQLLLVARAIFGAFAIAVNDTPEHSWARIRTSALYQWLLDEPSSTIRDELEALISTAFANAKFQRYLDEHNLSVLFLLECFHFLRLSNSKSQANDCLRKACDLSGLTVSFSAALGKRTRYQNESIAQLFVKVEAAAQRVVPAKTSDDELIDRSILPSNLSLDDDAFLNEVKFESNDGSPPNVELASTDQALILAKCISYADSLPKEDNFLKEEVAAFLQVVLKNPSDWAIQYHALYLRSVWEQLGSSSRKLDRALRQIDHLSSPDSFKFFRVMNEKNCDPAVDKMSHRADVLRHFFAALPPAPWTVQRNLGNLLTRLGCFASAVEIYERLHSWPDVITAYTRLERREKAESLIREQLNRKKTPEMLVFLGDCTGESVHYEEAWTLSKGRCSKAQRNLGFLLAQKKDFSGAAVCFEKCLAINPLQNPVWFAYGCVGFALNNFEMAATAFYKSTQLDNDNGEAWSNLATAYIKQGQKVRAVTILQEAIRCQYDNWRLWENYLLVTIDSGVFDEAIRAIHRLIDLRSKFIDADVMEIISSAVCKNIKDVEGNPCIKHRSALLELFGRIMSTSSPGAKISRYHADVILASSEATLEDVHRAISCLQRSIRVNLQAPSSSWHDNDFDIVKSLLDDALQLHDTFCKYSESPNAGEIDSLKSSLKYMLSQVENRVKAYLGDIVQNEENKSILESIVNSLEQLKQAAKLYH